MSATGYLKNKFMNLRLVSALAEEYHSMKEDNETLSKLISPDRLDVYDTHLLIDEHTYVRCIIGGMTHEDLDGIPPGMTSRALERIMELSFEGCKVDLCTGLIKVPRAETSKDLKEAYISNSIDQETARVHTKGSINDLQLENEAHDIRSTYNEIYYNSQNVYNASFIITIMGDEVEVFKAESHILGILHSELIEYIIPYDMMLPAFVASRPYPVSDERFWIRVHSDTAAVLCTSTSLNSRIDEQGLYFGKDKKTNAEILIDLTTFPSQHMIVFGPSGSGKTFTVSMLLMRAHDMLGKRIVYITPKADAGTDYRAVAEYYGNEATIIDIGEFGQSINPLQIIYDPQTMSDSPAAYSSAYFRHIRTLKNFFAVWMSDEFSSAAKGYLEDTLHKLYKAKGIIRTKPETWSNPFPVLSDLRDYFKKDMDNKDIASETRRSAGALYRKTSPIGEDGSLGYLNKDTKIDFSKDYIVIDISGVDEEIKPAMNVLITGIVGSRFKTDLEKETIIAVDEARVFLRNPRLSEFLLDTVAMGRSHGIALWLMTQNPGDLTKNKVDEEFKTNMPLAIVLGATLDPSKVGPVKDYFHLSETAVENLMNCEQGDGLLLISSRREEIPIRFEPTPQEVEIIKGRYTTKRPSPIICFDGQKIIPEYESLKDKHGVILKDWIDGDDSYLLSEGWERVSRLPKVTGRGTCTMWVPKGSINGNMIELPGLGKMTAEHFACAVQMESYLISQKIQCSSDHNQGPDVEFQIGNKVYASEYERAGSHTTEELIIKAGKLLTYDDFRFVVSPDDYPIISKTVDTVGTGKTITRGKDFVDWVQSLIVESSE
jgi:DNA helicase HerA-like ATPase